ncbi:MAG TPA: bifunctional UDP-N-acetylmuramoyl-tripeptide:D-alanyl-D-alanine ligase/alanine racemase [Chitinophagaceae bacterium]|nr:bifunctional UDP-N-acetylmuramoyl-tripeptide:D-alanyl-D-alanine ligase/alanine racemase [Chitinophagaceae bacterium]
MIYASEIENIVKGKLYQKGEEVCIEKLLFDSRKIVNPHRSIFVPLHTERRNAHQYIPLVYEAGVRVFFISEEIDLKIYPNAWFIKVDNTLSAVQRLSAYYRSLFRIPIIGITGSNGKTIVKEWLSQLLENEFKIVRSPKSFNSQIGVPSSVWLLREDTQLGIFEAGISLPHEMEQLEKIIKPNIGIFTNIGESHNEGFLNIRHKINEKLLLFKNAEVLIYNKDYPELHDCVLQFATNYKNNHNKEIILLSWSKKNEAKFKIIKIEKSSHQTNITAIYEDNPTTIQIPFIDDASIENAINCWLVLIYLGIDQNHFHNKFEKLQSIAMRLELLKGINHCTLINDSYNSDVSSFSVALDFLMQQNQHTNKTVILSDIFQSGRDNELYEEVASLIQEKKINKLIAIGDAISRNKKVFNQIENLHSFFYKNTGEFLSSLDSSSFQNECILLKGARKFTFEKITQRLQDRIHQTVMEINLGALSHNYKTYQSILNQGTKVMAMVKAFSYGAGSFEVANKLQFDGVDYLAVAYTDEGILLRKNGIKLPIMVMNADENSYDQIIEWKLEPEIYNFRTLQKMKEAAIANECSNYPIHLKLDTGMHRLGFEENDLILLATLLNQQHELTVVSVFSHLTGSEDQSLDFYTNNQATLFEKMTAYLSSHLSYSFIKHLSNSSAIIRHPHLQYDMVRLGLGLYGIDSTQLSNTPLRTVSQLKTSIAQIKLIKANDTVGYNRKGVATKDTIIGTVCIGYADGIPRRLGNGKGFMLLHQTLVPIIGNVCMDMCMLDITAVPFTKEGDTVEVFGENYLVQEFAKNAETIPYEILTGISQRVKRIYIEE